MGRYLHIICTKKTLPLLKLLGQLIIILLCYYTKAEFTLVYMLMVYILIYKLIYKPLNKL